MGKWKKSPQELVDRFYQALETFEQADMRKMFGYPCSFLNGNMFTGLHEENWVLRLPETDREELKGLGGKPFTPMGRTMKEYLTIPSAILKDLALLQEWVGRSYAFASSLPEKIKKS